MADLDRPSARPANPAHCRDLQRGSASTQGKSSSGLSSLAILNSANCFRLRRRRPSKFWIDLGRREGIQHGWQDGRAEHPVTRQWSQEPLW